MYSNTKVSIKKCLLFILSLLIFACGEERTKNRQADNQNQIANQNQALKSSTPKKDTSYDLAKSWPMFMYDISYHGKSQDRRLQPPLSVVWKFKTGGPVDSSPIVVNGTVYIGSDDNRIYALDSKNWGEKWYFNSGDRISYSPTYYKGMIYFGTRGNKVFALDALSGAKKWEFQADGWINAPVVAFNDRIYLGCYSNKIYILDANSGRKGGQGQSRMDVGNTAYTCVRGEFYPVDSYTRAFEWRKMVSSSESWPATAKGFVYLGSRDNNLYGFDLKTRKQVWSFETDGWVDSSPAIADGILYIGSRDGYVYALKNKSKSSDDSGSMGVVTRDDVKVYSRPDFGSDTKKGILNEGMSIPIIDKKSGWFRVRLPNKETGWLNGIDFIDAAWSHDLQVNQSIVKDVKRLDLPRGAVALSWSPDSSSMSFFSDVSSRSIYWAAESIWLASGDGSSPKWVSDGSFYNPNISWSGSSDSFAFESLTRTERQIWMAKSNGLDLKKVAVGESPAISPKGGKIAFIRRGKKNTGIWVRDLKNGMEKKVAEFIMKGEDSYIAYGYTPSVTAPAWSGDESNLAIGLDGYHYPDNNSRIAIVNTSRGLIKEIAVRSWRIKNIAWSPNGREIAFVTQEHSARQLDRYLDRKVHLVSIDGQNIDRVFDHSEGMSWSPDGKYLAFVEENDCMGMKRKVWMLDVNRGIMMQLLASRKTIEKAHWLTKNRIAILASEHSPKLSLKTQAWIININL